MKERTCARCREKFTPKKLNQQICQAQHFKKCAWCGGEMPWEKKGASCSPACRSELLKKTNREKYGTDYPQQSEKVKKTLKEKWDKEGNPSQTPKAKEKRRKTNIERYGTDNPLGSKEIQEKVKRTNLEKFGAEHVMRTKEGVTRQRKAMKAKYGVEHPLQVPEFRKKFEATAMERYGVSHPFQALEVQEKTRQTLIEKYGTVSLGGLNWFKEKVKVTSQERYGTDHPMQSEEVQAKSRNTNLEKLGVPYPSQNPSSKLKAQESFSKRVEENGFSHRRVSKLNKEFAARLEERYGVSTKLECPFSGGAADIGIEGLLIDLNPTITHNSAISFVCIKNKCSQPCVKHSPKSKTSHFERARAAKNDEIKLLQFYDWDSPEKIFNFLDARLLPGFQRISARKLRVADVPGKLAKSFLEENHVQGSVRGQLTRIGLYADEELIAYGSFGKARFGAKEDFEWYRYAVKKGFIVHGGSNMVWREFLRKTSPKSVVSYVDFNHTTSPQIFLNSVGFKEDAPTGPTLIWYNPVTKIKITDSALRKIGADRLLSTSYGPREVCGLSNSDILLLEGYLPVYTAGNRVFRWRQ